MNNMKYKKVHLIGIGGSSMSGIAKYLLDNNIEVTGSNNESNHNVDELLKKGIHLSIGHKKENITDQDLVIYTSAIKEDNEELLEAKKKSIKTLERAEFLGLLTKELDNSICVSGTHGKSTTSSMISLCFLEAKLDPTIQVGAVIKEINSNCHTGKSNYFIMEACEYKDQFLNFYPKIEVILNIDTDHLDYFKTFDNIVNSFKKYTHNIKDNGYLILNADDENVLNLKHETNSKTITYGINNECDYQAKNITYDESGKSTFTVNDKQYSLNIKGTHNIYNALATIAVCDIYKIDYNNIKNGLLKYSGVKRRFEYLGCINNNVKIYDDYAHHPTEIKTTLDSVNKTKHNESWAIFQSHTYSRTKQHLEEFAEILSKFDHIVIAKIYPAREENIYNVNEEQLVNLIKNNNKNVIYIDNFKGIEDYIINNVKQNDIVISIGAGPINDVTNNLIKNHVSID